MLATFAERIKLNNAVWQQNSGTYTQNFYLNLANSQNSTFLENTAHKILS